LHLQGATELPVALPRTPSEMRVGDVHQNPPEPSLPGPLMRVRTGSSFLRLLWPFEIARAGNRSHYEGIVRNVQRAVDPGGRPLWQNLDLPVDMLLTHCSDHLNCWDGSPDHPRRDHETGHFWRIDKSSQASGAVFDPSREWLARQGSGKRATSVSFSVTDAHLVIFRQHVGFVILEIVSRSLEPADWLFLANRLRTLGGSGHRRSSSNGPIIEVAASSVPPFFTPTGEVRQGEPNTFSGRLGEVFEWLARESLPGSTLRHPWVRDSALPYFSLFVETVGGAPDHGSELPAGLFDLGERVRRFFRADQAVQATHEELTPAVIMYAPNQYHSYSLDGGTFYACDAPDTEFFNNTLPDHLRRYYFLNYLFALHQRLVLMQLSDAIADRWMEGPSVLHEPTVTVSGDEESKAKLERLVRAFEEIRDELLEFSARGYFIQFMYSQNHHRDYRRWQETFEVAEFHREVQNQLHEIYAALSLRFEEIASRRRQLAEELEHQKTATQTSFTYILAIFGVVSLVLAFFGVEIRGETQYGISIWKLFTFGVIAAAVGAGIAYLVHREILRRGPRE
jgi:hypothetical protein